jgi:hypothetical protein
MREQTVAAANHKGWRAKDEDVMRMMRKRRRKNVD